MKKFIDQLRDYDVCFETFLIPSMNGQKHMQTILLRESFKYFSEENIGIKHASPTNILDVSCGRGDYSASWTCSIAKYVSGGINYFCTDIPEGFCKDSGECYIEATKRKIKAVAHILKLCDDPVGVECDLYSGVDVIIPFPKQADIVHWSHSGYHVRDALGPKKNNLKAIEQGLQIAIAKIWSALDEEGLMFSIHQSNDTSDNVPAQMATLARPFTGILDNVPWYIEKNVHSHGGWVTTVHFGAPVKFPIMKNNKWQLLKNPKAWEFLDQDQQHTLRLLNFIAHDFTDENKAGLEKLAESGKLGEFIDIFKNAVQQNSDYIICKCAFQMACKSKIMADKLDTIGRDLRQRMPEFIKEMAETMMSAKKEHSEAVTSLKLTNFHT
ncbi:unnamed protein product [Adineta ricciae]|uniref:Methyltransferase domain-containing protein n=1 Tax=Adineta ricciae TaxID=249248 RepID=A0A815VWA0_ADIRI|nr:unnamed protein product [Adineta ricciae]CAF1653725.1 unnamed protein product [Adineta ricciae]